MGTIDPRVEELTRALALCRAERDAARAEIDVMTALLSHDARPPLHAVADMSDTILREERETMRPAAREDVRLVRDAARRVAELVGHLVRLGRLTRAEILPVEIDLSALARDVADEVATRHATRAVAFEAKPGLRVTADLSLTRTLLDILFDNAWKFTATVSTPKVTFGDGTAPGDRPERFFVVRDNGVGFDAAGALGQFALFRPAEPPRELPHAGIGLAAAERIVRRHGGRFWIESQPGAGAAAYFTLPSPPAD